MEESTSFLYRSGNPVAQITLDEVALPKGDEEFVFVYLRDPSAGDFTALQATFKLHDLALEDALGSFQVPKLDLYDHQIFVLLKTAELNGDCIAYGEISVFLSKRFIIIVSHGDSLDFTQFSGRLTAMPASQCISPDFILHTLTDYVVDSYLPVMQMIEDDILGFEQTVLEAFLGREQITRIFRLRREVIHFQRVTGKMADLCSKIVHLNVPCVGEEVRPYFNDVLDHLQRLHIFTSNVVDIITSVFETSSLLEQQRQGVITRQLAAWAGILAVPTAIAGIYGMNFKNMPELGWAYGYFIILGLIGCICLILHRQFKKAGWL